MAVPALDPGIGETGQDEVGKSVDENGDPVPRNNGSSQQQVNERSTEKHKPGHRVQKMRHGVEVTEPLCKGHFPGEQWIVRPQDLYHATRPADALSYVRRKRLGSETGRLWNVDIRGVVPLLLHAQRRVRVFCYRLGGDASTLIERRAAKQGAGAAKEGGIPKVIAVLHDAVEQLPFIRNGLVLQQVAFEWVR